MEGRAAVGPHDWDWLFSYAHGDSPGSRRGRPTPRQKATLPVRQERISPGARVALRWASEETGRRATTRSVWARPGPGPRFLDPRPSSTRSGPPLPQAPYLRGHQSKPTLVSTYPCSLKGKLDCRGIFCALPDILRKSGTHPANCSVTQKRDSVFKAHPPPRDWKILFWWSVFKGTTLLQLQPAPFCREPGNATHAPCTMLHKLITDTFLILFSTVF